MSRGESSCTGALPPVEFQRTFLLADGMIVKDATLSHGMLVIALERPRAPKLARRIDIRSL